MVPEWWECRRSWVRAWPEGGERRIFNGSGHEHRPTGRRKPRKSVLQKAALRRGRYAWHCALKAITGITALSASLLYSLSTQRVVRNHAWPHKGASSQGRRHKGRIEKTGETCAYAAQYCAARRAVLLSGPPSHILQEARTSRITLPLKRERDSGTFAPACLRRGSVQHASRGYGPGVCWRPSGQVASRPAATSQTGRPVGQPARFAGQAPPGNGGKRATQQQTQQF